jgi:glycosyltransferase involved in cell wall biosynthesis
MSRVLFITYYWPPSGKASIHWPLKIINCLPEFGCVPAVLTVEEDTFSQKDFSLLNRVDKNLKVIKTKSFEPFNLYRKFTGKGKEEQLVASETISLTNKSLSHRISIWIRMNLFIPDARIGWFPYAVAGGGKLLSKNRFDAVVSIGPPHTTQLIGMKLAKQFRIPHFPVFIDPWVDIVYYRNFKRSSLTLAIDNYFEKSVISNSAKAVFVTDTMRDDFVKKYPFIKDRAEVLYWGYDEDEFAGFQPVNKPGEMVILHSGNIFDFQNPVKFWGTVKKMIGLGKNIRLKFTGTVSPGIKNSISAAGLEPYTDYLGFLPYDKLIKTMEEATYLMVCPTEPRHLPGKLFEYLRTGKTILAFGNDNKDVQDILRRANAGMLFRYDEDAEIFFEKAGNFSTDIEIVKQYDRRNMARKLSEIIEQEISSKY